MSVTPDLFRLRREVTRACGRASEPLALLAAVATRVRSAIPYEAAGWLLTDPTTRIVTAAHAENVSMEMHQRLMAAELSDVPDLNRFVELAGREVPVATLHESTGGDLRRSARYRDLYEPEGLGDELRAVFRSGGVPWGRVCLIRGIDDPPFDVEEVDAIADVVEHVGNGLCVGLVLGEIEEPQGAAELPGMIVLDEQNRVVSTSGEAARWIAALPRVGMELPFVVYEVAHQARAVERDGRGRPPYAREHAGPTGWASVRAANLGSSPSVGRLAVVIETARSVDVDDQPSHARGAV